MNEDFSQLEDQLRALTPTAPSTGLERRVAAMAGTLLHMATTVPSSSTKPIAPVAAQATSETMARTLASADPLSQVQDGAASSVVYQTSDEGVVLTTGQQPARRVRYLSEDTVKWRNPRTGADIEVSYPREEVVLTPIAAR